MLREINSKRFLFKSRTLLDQVKSTSEEMDISTMKVEESKCPVLRLSEEADTAEDVRALVGSWFYVEREVLY